MDIADVKAQVRDRILAAQPGTEPFPHVVIDNLLPPTVLAEMHRYWPSSSQVKTLGELGRVHGNPYPARKVTPFKFLEKMLDAERLPFWLKMRELFSGDDFNGSLLRVLKQPLVDRTARAGLKGKAYTPDTLIVEDGEGYAISPHTDMPKRLMTVLVYLPEDLSMIQYGTSLYRPKVDFTGKDMRGHYPFELFDRVTTVDFIPNRLVAFIRDDNTFHGVETVKAPPQPRRLIIHQLEEAQVVSPPEPPAAG